jgi:hypothetical protein
MIARSPVPFERLQELLLELGFSRSKGENSWVFSHPPSKAVLTYRLYRPRERVLLKDMLVTRQELEWRDVMTPSAFDNRLQRAIA